jgi:hypothetical protein
MMVVSVYHIGAVGYRVYVQRKRMAMLPGMEDVLHDPVIQVLRGTRKRPQQGRYTFEEKAEYWAVVWGPWSW